MPKRLQDGKTWMWAADAIEEDEKWKFTEDGDGFSRWANSKTGLES